MVLITGCRGFIGRHVEGVGFTGDVRDKQSILDQTEGITGIVHLASVSSNYSCERRIMDTITTNLTGVLNVLEVAYEKKLWVVFVSTYQVESCTLYGLSKLMGEELCRVFKDKGLAVSTVRLPIVFGENDREHKVVTKLIGQVTRGEQVDIRTDEKLDFMYVQDAVDLIECTVDVIKGKSPRNYTLTELTDAIEKVLVSKEV